MEAPRSTGGQCWLGDPSVWPCRNRRKVSDPTCEHQPCCSRAPRAGAPQPLTASVRSPFTPYPLEQTREGISGSQAFPGRRAGSFWARCWGREPTAGASGRPAAEGEGLYSGTACS